MKLLRPYLLYGVVHVFVLDRCRHENASAFDTSPEQPIPDNVVLNSEFTTIASARITCQKFPGVKRWQVEWEEYDWENMEMYARLFGGITCPLYNLHLPNSLDRKTIAHVHMDLDGGRVQSPAYYSSLIDESHVIPTGFRPCDLSAEELMDITENNPGLFEDLFENDAYYVTNFQPYDYEDGERMLYAPGDIFLFKTGQIPFRYGAVRIIDTSRPCMIEVIVQTTNAAVFPDYSSEVKNTI